MTQPFDLGFPFRETTREVRNFASGCKVVVNTFLGFSRACILVSVKLKEFLKNRLKSEGAVS
jgi:hypothetical protein